MAYLGKDGQYMLHKWLQDKVLPIRDRYVAFLLNLKMELEKISSNT